MRLILHIGAAKTGSTALQTALTQQADDLEQKGFWVVSSAGRGNARALVAACMDFSKSDDFIYAQGLTAAGTRTEFRKRVCQNLSDEIHRAKQEGCHTAIISSEHFQSRLTSSTELDECAALFSALFDEVSIAVYLRRQDRLAVSRFSEYLRAGFAPSHPFFELDDCSETKLPLFFDHFALMNRWALAFGESAMMPAVYEPNPMEAWSVVRDFAERARVPLTSSHASNPIHRELPLSAQSALLRFNDFMGVENRRDAELAALRDQLVVWLTGHYSGMGFRPPRGEAIQFLEHFRSGNRLVANRWFTSTDQLPIDSQSEKHNVQFLEGATEQELFDVDFSEYPQYADALNTADSEETLVEAVKALNCEDTLRQLCTRLGRKTPSFIGSRT